MTVHREAGRVITLVDTGLIGRQVGRHVAYLVHVR